MSASTIAQWNAIPLSRPEPSPGSQNLKRQRDEDDDDDDISIASYTPSPPPPDRMDVDEDITRYDEYVRAPAREVITVETKIKPTNKGFALLSKLGWSEGQPLGLSEDGRVDPIPFSMKADSTGIGKDTQDVRMIESTVSQRRELDSERQQKESDEQRQARENAVARRTALASQISDTLKAFYCSLCDKQFQNVAQYDEHTNSYAHHHKARLRDMQANARITPQEEIDKRKEKERKREERELRKMAAASGIKMAKQTTAPTASLAAIPVTPISSTPGSSSTGGWAAVSHSSESKPSGFRKSGWTAISSGGVSVTPPAQIPLPPSPPPEPSASPWTTSLPSNTTGSVPQIPPLPPSSDPPPSSNRNGWQQFQKNNSKRR